MLENIKSINIIKKLFNQLDEKAKLNLIKYNKAIQTKINIDIINYKLFIGKYIIYDLDIKGKEYDSENNLIFFGEYLNGKRNGKGYEFNKDNIIFEGEYLNGKRNGKGREYDDYGNLIFEGEYLNGKRNGKGKEYDRNGLLIFEGIYLNDEKNKGILKKYRYDGTLFFQGEYLYGKINGKVKEYNFNGKLKFEGE